MKHHMNGEWMSNWWHPIPIFLLIALIIGVAMWFIFQMGWKVAKKK